MNLLKKQIRVELERKIWIQVRPQLLNKASDTILYGTARPLRNLFWNQIREPIWDVLDGEITT